MCAPGSPFSVSPRCSGPILCSREASCAQRRGLCSREAGVVATCQCAAFVPSPRQPVTHLWGTGLFDTDAERLGWSWARGPQPMTALWTGEGPTDTGGAWKCFERFNCGSTGGGSGQRSRRFSLPHARWRRLCGGFKSRCLSSLLACPHPSHPHSRLILCSNDPTIQSHSLPCYTQPYPTTVVGLRVLDVRRARGTDGKVKGGGGIGWGATPPLHCNWP